jgi:hypothetical protein
VRVERSFILMVAEQEIGLFCLMLFSETSTNDKRWTTM